MVREEIHSRSALLVDAREGPRQELPKILRPPEWIIKEVSNNAEALELVTAKPFDIIITGQDTPAYADIQLLRCIRRINPHTRVIILTDESTQQDVLDAIREDAFGYFCRPFSFAELEDAIRQAIEAPAWDEGIEIVWASSEWVRLIVRCDLQSAVCRSLIGCSSAIQQLICDLKTWRIPRRVR